MNHKNGSGMVFEQRNLKSHAEPVTAPKLKEGSVYFSLNYADDEMLLPHVEPLVFIGRNLDSGDARQVYFQDVDSYREGIRYSAEANDDRAQFWSGSEREINHIFEYEDALEELMRCSLRRRNADG